MDNVEQGTSEATRHLFACRERAEAYDRYLSILRRKLTSYQGGYLLAVRREAEQIHCQWLLANQELFLAEMSIR